MPPRAASHNKPAQPHSQAVDQWGSNDWPTVCHDNIAKKATQRMDSTIGFNPQRNAKRIP